MAILPTTPPNLPPHATSVALSPPGPYCRACPAPWCTSHKPFCDHSSNHSTPHTHILPSQDCVAGGALDVGHSVQPRDELPVLTGAEGHVHPAHHGKGGGAEWKWHDWRGSMPHACTQRRRGCSTATHTSLNRYARPCTPWKALLIMFWWSATWDRQLLHEYIFSPERYCLKIWPCGGSRRSQKWARRGFGERSIVRPRPVPAPHHSDPVCRE